MRRHVFLGLLLSTSLGCTALGGVTPRPGASGKPGKLSPQAIPSAPGDIGGLGGPSDLISKARLTGKVKLISDHGASVISNQGGNVLSDNGLGLVSDAGGGVLSDNGLGLISKARYALAQAPPPVEGLLAEARIAVVDAAGKPVLDAAGKPIEATTDRTGTYAIAAELPPKTLVLKVRLWNGGELSAMLPYSAQAKREQTIDTATSLGAAFVLGEYVKGDQSILDKLPQAESERLRNFLDAARGLIGKKPSYQAGELVALTQDLRSKSSDVDKSLGEIRALLLGQANLGAGRGALEVPLTDARAIAPDLKGGFYIAEGVPGRIRHIAADGTVSIFADQLHGTIKQNFYRVVDLATGPDGSLYVVSNATSTVSRIFPDGRVTVVAGTGKAESTDADRPAHEVGMRPCSVAVEADGTLWIGELSLAGLAPRVLRVGTDGVAREPAPAIWGSDWRISGLAKGGDGAYYALLVPKNAPAQFFKLAAGAKTWESLPWAASAAGESDLASAPDGALYFTEDLAGRLVHLGLDGTRKVMLDVAAGEAVKRPSDVMAWPGGHVRLIDGNRSQVYEVSPELKASLIAGAQLGASASGDAIALSGPFGAAVDPTGGLYLTDLGSHSIRRWTGSELVTFAGGVKGFSGDGGQATAARFDEPNGLAFRGTSLLVHDKQNSRIREIGADGKVNTVLGGVGTPFLTPGEAAAADTIELRSGGGLAVGPNGEITLSVLGSHQVLRQGADGKVRLLAGLGKGSSGDGGPATEARLSSPGALAYGPDGSLYVTDSANMRIRRIVNPGGTSPTMEAYAGLDGLAAISGFSADPLPDTTRAEAVFAFPGSLCFDKAGNLYVGEFGTLSLTLIAGVVPGIKDMPLADLPKVPARIRKITPDGRVTTVAGPGGKFFSDTSKGDALLLPAGLTIDKEGRLVIVDSGANLVRFLPAGSY